MMLAEIPRATTGPASHTLRTELFPALLEDCYRHQRRNYDALRFGNRLTRRLREALVDTVGPLITRAGFVMRHPALDRATDRLRFVVENLESLEWFYDRLADEYSRRLLVDLLRFRILGRAYVKLPTNNAAYWQKEASIDRDLLVERHTKQPWLWHLNQYRVPGAAGPIELHAHQLNILDTFLLEQYGYHRDGTTIRAQPGDVVIDGGSCWGDAALYFADLVGPTGKVYAMEFVPDNIAIITENLNLNRRLRDRVSIVERALSDRSDQTISYQPDGPSTSLIRVDPWGGLVAEAPTIAIDDLVHQESIEHVNFIKLDVEGFELKTLIGARNTIQNDHPTLAISLYHNEDDIVTIPAYLEEIAPDYEFFLDHFTIHSEETVLFAQSRGRGTRA